MRIFDQAATIIYDTSKNARAKIISIRLALIDSVNKRFDTNFPEPKKLPLTIRQVFDVTI